MDRNKIELILTTFSITYFILQAIILYASFRIYRRYKQKFFLWFMISYIFSLFLATQGLAEKLLISTIKEPTNLIKSILLRTFVEGLMDFAAWRGRYFIDSAFVLVSPLIVAIALLVELRKVLRI